MTVGSALRDAALRWITEDVDAGTAEELQHVLGRALGGEPDAQHELAERMAGPLTFGTAGLRGPVRAGPNGMNRAVVVRASAGVASWLTAHGHAGGIVVVGRDARHGSAEFAADTAAVLAGAGFDARVLPGPLPTPVLAYAVRALGAVAGVQVTASHNPPADNGYKVYDATGAQIVPPADSEIEAAIGAAPAARLVPRGDAAVLGDDVLSGYLARVAALPVSAERELRVAATAMHGVGAATLRAALTGAGFAEPVFVAEQAEPDPDFPTVSFPNPEEPGAADRLLALAAEIDADLAVALDPDADRCALGIRGADGAWRMLRGDETGVLLGEHVLASLASTADSPLVATTIVSSAMLGRIAAARGARYAETLTGFKWLVRAGDGLVFAYEEALGLCVDPASVRDKDGISAAVRAAELAARLRAAGSDLTAELDRLATAYGVHRTAQVSLRFADTSRIGALMSRLRSAPPAELLGAPVTVTDLLPDADVLRLTGDGVRVIVRPSGTEPKLKAYLEVVSEVDGTRTDHALPAARATAESRISTLTTEVHTLLTD